MPPKESNCLRPVSRIGHAAGMAAGMPSIQEPQTLVP